MAATPPQRDPFAGFCDADDEACTPAKKSLAATPGENCLCHGCLLALRERDQAEPDHLLAIPPHLCSATHSAVAGFVTCDASARAAVKLCAALLSVTYHTYPCVAAIRLRPGTPVPSSAVARDVAAVYMARAQGLGFMEQDTDVRTTMLRDDAQAVTCPPASCLHIVVCTTPLTEEGSTELAQKLQYHCAAGVRSVCVSVVA